MPRISLVTSSTSSYPGMPRRISPTRGNLAISTPSELRSEGHQAVIGITDYAQDQLGDIVYIELPWDAGQDITNEGKFGDIESVKATSELMSPISGDIVAVNEDLKEHPELINDDPYDKGW